MSARRAGAAAWLHGCVASRKLPLHGFEGALGIWGRTFYVIGAFSPTRATSSPPGHLCCCRCHKQEGAFLCGRCGGWGLRV